MPPYPIWPAMITARELDLYHFLVGETSQTYSSDLEGTWEWRVGPRCSLSQLFLDDKICTHQDIVAIKSKLNKVGSGLISYPPHAACEDATMAFSKDLSLSVHCQNLYNPALINNQGNKCSNSLARAMLPVRMATHFNTRQRPSLLVLALFLSLRSRALSLLKW